MKEVTATEFIMDARELLYAAVKDDEFLKIRTRSGNAVLISEAEWNILVDAMKTVLAAAAR